MRKEIFEDAYKPLFCNSFVQDYFMPKREFVMDFFIF